MGIEKELSITTTKVYYFFFFQIFFAILTSIVVPLLLGSLQLLKNGPKIISDQFYHSGIFKKFIILLALPLYPIYFKIQELMFSEASKEYIISVDSWIHWKKQAITQHNFSK